MCDCLKNKTDEFSQLYAGGINNVIQIGKTYYMKMFFDLVVYEEKDDAHRESKHILDFAIGAIIYCPMCGEKLKQGADEYPITHRII